MKKTLRIVLAFLIGLVILSLAALFIMYEVKAERRINLSSLVADMKLERISIYRHFSDGIYRIELSDPADLREVTTAIENLRVAPSTYKAEKDEWHKEMTALTFDYADEALTIFIEPVSFGFFRVKASGHFHYMTRDNIRPIVEPYFNEATREPVAPHETPRYQF